MIEITDEAFHQWKQNDCTISLIKLIDSLIDKGEKSIVGHVLGKEHIDIESLSIYKGELLGLDILQKAILDKNTLEMEAEDEME